jgi:hypothetical protein
MIVIDGPKIMSVIMVSVSGSVKESGSVTDCSVHDEGWLKQWKIAPSLVSAAPMFERDGSAPYQAVRWMPRECGWNAR